MSVPLTPTKIEKSESKLIVEMLLFSAHLATLLKTFLTSSVLLVEGCQSLTVQVIVL